MRSKALFAPRPALAKRAARDTRNETAASIEKPKSRYRRSRSANRARTRRTSDTDLETRGFSETASSRVGASSAAARAGNAACASRRRLEGGGRALRPHGRLVPDRRFGAIRRGKRGVREKRPIRDRAVLRAE